jgi:hypothetical protein
MARVLDVVESHRFALTTGLTTGLAANGDMLAVRTDTSGKAFRLRSLEVQAITTTAFAAAQRIGFHAYTATTFSAAHTGGGAVTFTGGKMDPDQDSTILEGRISDTAVLTADGSTVLDANPFARASAWSGAIGATLGPVFYDLTGNKTGGLIITADKGFVIENAVAMGGSGVVVWHFIIEGDTVTVQV